MKRKTQLERVRGRLLERGTITRNECLSQFPAITRLGARIANLKDEGYVFDAKWQGGDYVYTLLSINGVPFTPRPRFNSPEALQVARQAIATFDAQD